MRKHQRDMASHHWSASDTLNDLTIGWRNLNLLSHANSTLAPQARQAKPSGENLKLLTESLVWHPGKIIDSPSLVPLGGILWDTDICWTGERCCRGQNHYHEILFPLLSTIFVSIKLSHTMLQHNLLIPTNTQLKLSQTEIFLVKSAVLWLSSVCNDLTIGWQKSNVTLIQH